MRQPLATLGDGEFHEHQLGALRKHDPGDAMPASTGGRGLVFMSVSVCLCSGAAVI